MTNRKTPVLGAMLVLLPVLAAGCGDHSSSGSRQDACQGIDCSGNGFCVAIQGEAQCECASGYVAVTLPGPDCVPDGSDADSDSDSDADTDADSDADDP